MNATDNRDSPGVIAWPPLIFGGCAIFGGLLHLVHPLHILGNRSLSLGVGIFIAVGAAALAISAGRMMRAAGTNIRPDLPALAVVKTGPYRFTRNPMYLALCLLQVALGFLLDDWMPMLGVIPLALILHFGVILREEKYLEAKFGEQYLALKRSVRRWI